MCCYYCTQIHCVSRHYLSIVWGRHIQTPAETRYSLIPLCLLMTTGSSPHIPASSLFPRKTCGERLSFVDEEQTRDLEQGGVSNPHHAQPIDLSIPTTLADAVNFIPSLTAVHA